MCRNAFGTPSRISHPCAISEHCRAAPATILVRNLPQFGDDYAVIGSWVVAGEVCGICIREDKSPITQNLSRFVPHFILD